MTIARRHIIQSTSAAALLACIGQQAYAQSVENMRVVTGFPPGGTSDTVSYTHLTLPTT